MTKSVPQFSAKTCPWRAVLLRSAETVGAITFGHRLTTDELIIEFYGLRDGRLFRVGTKLDGSADACFPAATSAHPDGVPLVAVRIVEGIS